MKRMSDFFIDQDHTGADRVPGSLRRADLQRGTAKAREAREETKKRPRMEVFLDMASQGVDLCTIFGLLVPISARVAYPTTAKPGIHQKQPRYRSSCRTSRLCCPGSILKDIFPGTPTILLGLMSPLFPVVKGAEQPIVVLELFQCYYPGHPAFVAISPQVAFCPRLQQNLLN